MDDLIWTPIEEEILDDEADDMEAAMDDLMGIGVDSDDVEYIDIIDDTGDESGEECCEENPYYTYQGDN